MPNQSMEVFRHDIPQNDFPPESSGVPHREKQGRFQSQANLHLYFGQANTLVMKTNKLILLQLYQIQKIWCQTSHYTP